MRHACYFYGLSFRQFKCILGLHIEWIVVTSRCTIQCFILQGEVWYQSTDPGGIKVWLAWTGGPNEEHGITCAQQSSDCAITRPMAHSGGNFSTYLIYTARRKRQFHPFRITAVHHTEARAMKSFSDLSYTRTLYLVRSTRNSQRLLELRYRLGQKLRNCT